MLECLKETKEFNLLENQSVDLNMIQSIRKSSTQLAGNLQESTDTMENHFSQGSVHHMENYAEVAGGATNSQVYVEAP